MFEILLQIVAEQIKIQTMNTYVTLFPRHFRMHFRESKVLQFD